MPDGQAKTNTADISSDYRKVFDAAPDPMIVCGRDGAILAYNAASPVKFRFTHDEFSLLRLSDLDATMKSEPRMKALLALKEEEELDTEVQFHRKDRMAIDFEASYHPIQWAGQPALLAIFRDVTQRKLLESSVSSYQAQVLAVMNSTDDYVWSIDAKDLKLLSFNDAFESFFKSSRGIAPKLGMLPGELLGKGVSAKWIGFYETALKDGRFSTEYWLEKERKIILLNLHSIKKGGRIIGLSGFCKDITEKKRAEEEIKRSEAYRRALFESARDAILILRDGKFIDCNPAALLLYGRKREQIIGRTPEDFSPERQRDGSFTSALAPEKIKLAMEGSNAVFDWQHRKGDGTLIDCEVNLNKLELEGEVLLQAIVRDITERKGTIQALLESGELLKSVIDSMSDLLWCVDAGTFELLVFNRSFKEYFGKRRGGDPRKGMLPEDMTGKGEIASLWHSLYKRAKSEGAFQAEYIADDGSRFLAFFNLLRTEGKVFGISVTAKDLAGIIKAEEANMAL